MPGNFPAIARALLQFLTGDIILAFRGGFWGECQYLFCRQHHFIIAVMPRQETCHDIMRIEKCMYQNAM